MELKMNARAKSLPIPAEPAAQREEAIEQPGAPVADREKIRADRIELSKKAVDYVNGHASEQGEELGREEEPLTKAEEHMKKKADKRKLAKQMLDAVRMQSLQMQEQSKKQTDSMQKALDKMKKCSRIAAHIQKGGKVPPEDEKYLIEHDPKLYMMAMAMRMMKKDKDKKYDSELTEEDLRGEENSTEAVEPTEGGVQEAEAAE